jgi:hypothetical protein
MVPQCARIAQTPARIKVQRYPRYAVRLRADSHSPANLAWPFSRQLVTVGVAYPRLPVELSPAARRWVPHISQLIRTALIVGCLSTPTLVDMERRNLFRMHALCNRQVRTRVAAEVGSQKLQGFG